MTKLSLPSHIEWLRRNYLHKIEAKIAQTKPLFLDEYRECRDDVERVLATLVAADPSAKKGAVDWLLKTWMEGGLLWEDCMDGAESKACETLSWFAEWRKHLQGPAKNLSSYQNLGSVFRSIEKYIPQVDQKQTLSSRAERRAERARVIANSIILQRTADMIMAVPQTKEASQWWGRGTRWCTAADKRNYFDEYNRDAPLVVCIFSKLESNGTEETRKFQIWVHNKYVQFMNEADEPVDPKLIQENWLSFEPLLKWAFNLSAQAIEWFPADQITKEMADKAVELSPGNLSFIPLNLRTHELCMKAIEVSWNVHSDNISLSLIPEEFRDREFWLSFCSKHPNYMESMPKEYQTEEFVEGILKRDIGWLSYVDQSLITEQGMINIMQYHKFQGRGRYWDLKDVPQNLRTESILLQYSGMNPVALLEFAKAGVDITAEMAMRAIKLNGSSIRFVPKHLQSREIIEQAIKNDIAAFIHLSADQKTSDLCRKIAANPGMKSLEWIPMARRTPDICLKLACKNVSNFDCIPPSILDRDFCNRLIESNPLLLSQIPSRFTDQELWQRFTLREPHLMKPMPMNFITDEFAREFSKKHPQCISFLPTRSWNKEILERGVRENPYFIKKIPLDLLTVNLVKLAVSKDVSLSENVPRRMLNSIIEEEKQHEGSSPTEKRLICLEDEKKKQAEEKDGKTETKNRSFTPQWSKEILSPLFIEEKNCNFPSLQ